MHKQFKYLYSEFTKENIWTNSKGLFLKKINGLKITTLATMIVITFNLSCKKLVEIKPPINTISSSEVFSDSSNADAQVLGIYQQMFNIGNDGRLAFGNGILTFYCGSSADELVPFLTSNTDQFQFYTNSLNSNNATLKSYFWSQPYFIIYQSSACIEGVQSSNGISSKAKGIFTGEAKFMRAFCYFYLVNLFGDVPIVTTTNWEQTGTIARSSKDLVYQLILNDLKDAQELLPGDYVISNNQRIRANKFAATALLARVYLYLKDYKNAEIQAGTLINNLAYFNLASDLNSVFLSTSQEAILQWSPNTKFIPYNVTPEGYYNIPKSASGFPYFYISNQLLGSFENGDNRKVAWIDSSTFNSKTYYYPYKYKEGPAQLSINAAPTESYIVLRLAEQYLIKAEAEAQLGENTALSDLNIIRIRAGLPGYNNSLNKDSLLNAIYHEREVELFAEWGHRWFDLKRVGAIDSVMKIITPLKGGVSWNSNYELYPIPFSEIQADPNLIQNSSY